jgi:hypothetical protein
MNRGEWRQAAEYFADDVRHHLGVWQEVNQRTVGGKKLLTDNLEDIFGTFPIGGWRSLTSWLKAMPLSRDVESPGHIGACNAARERRLTTQSAAHRQTL